jgi:phosphatidylinositol-3-phosphatase
MRKAALLLALASLLGVRAATAAPPPAFAHVVIVVFENKEATSVLGRRAAPTFNAYSRRYATLTRYYGVTHPSLPNYLALVSGSTQGVTSDCVTCSFDALSLADTLESSGRTWKTYAEDLPDPGFLGGSSGEYVKKHDPFAYFQAVASSPQRARQIVPLTELGPDLRSARLPDFALVIPNLCHSMHDCAVSVGDAWLRRTIGPLLSLPRTVVFVVFDEGSSNVGGGGHVAALALGKAVRPHSTFRATTNHYGLLRTIEEAWNLPLLGRSAGARAITGIWR